MKKNQLLNDYEDANEKNPYFDIKYFILIACSL